MHEPLYGCELVIIQYAFGCEILEYYIFQAISLIPHFIAYFGLILREKKKEKKWNNAIIGALTCPQLAKEIFKISMEC